MKKRLSALVLALSMTLSLVSCGSPADENSSASSSAAGTPEDTAFPVTVTDALDRSVTIETEPEKLVSGYYITTSMLIALDQADKLVGVEAKADTRPIYAEAAPHILDLPSVGTAKEFDLEGCTALQPDLVILPVKLKNVVPALEELGLTVLTVRPESREELDETITLLGTATGARDQAQALLDFNARTREQLADVLLDMKRPTVYLAGNSSYLSTAGIKMYQNDMLELGGGINVAAELEDDYWTEISYEQLLAGNPEVIIMASDAAYAAEELMADPQLAQLDAVKNGRVYHMDGDYTLEAWDSPVPSTVLGSCWVAAQLYQSEETLKLFRGACSQFYQNFYDLDVGAGFAAMDKSVP